MDQEDLVEIYRAKDSVQAALVQQALRDAGIRAEVENLLLSGGTAEIPGWSTNPRIMIEVKDEAAARTVIAQFEQAESAGEASREAGSDALSCLECGTPIPSGVTKCPNCGWTYDQSRG